MATDAAPPRRRLALGVGHHEVVGVVRRRERHETGTRRLDLVAVVLGGEEDGVVQSTKRRVIA